MANVHEDERELPVELSIDFDTPAYEEARLMGLDAYREFHQVLEQMEVVDRGAGGDPDYERYGAQLTKQREYALLRLPGISADLSIRTLAVIAGNLTWGALEYFYGYPTLPGTDTPASERLRGWYEEHRLVFDSLFPEHRRMEVPDESEVEPSSFDGFSQWLLEIAVQHAAARERPLSRSLLFGVLLRDYAPWLQPLGRAFNFSISNLISRALLGETPQVEPTMVSAHYEELGTEGLPGGPARMFAALVIPGIDEIGFRLPRNDLVAAIRGMEASGQTGPRNDPLVQGHANSDLPTKYDQIGVKPLVEGLQALLDDERTGLSLSIGITAPWGGGKSSVMSQLREALSREEPGRTREWIPIHFDAWKYERSERLWAALSKAIYEQSIARMDPWERTRFKFSLERARRGWLAFWGWPLLLAALLIGFGVLLTFQVSLAAGALAVLATILGFGGFVGVIWGLLSDPFKRALEGYVSDPSYEEQLGFTSDADADIRRLTEKLTATGNRALVVFVDDLDRCSPRHVVEAVEAINQIFNASEDSRCVFILGMDRDMVVASIEVAYEETIAKLREERQRNFGMHFLSKLVQLSVAVPPPSQEGIERLLESIGEPEKTKVKEPSPEGQNLQFKAGPLSGEVHTEGGGEMSQEASSGDGKPAQRAGEDESKIVVDESSPEFHRAERLAAAYLERNPREVKRFDNAFRLQLQVAWRTSECKLRFDEDDLIAVGKWVAMRLRWPDLAADIDRDPALLPQLEKEANGDAPPKNEWANEADLIDLLQEPVETRRIARLQDPGFLRIS